MIAILLSVGVSAEATNTIEAEYTKSTLNAGIISNIDEDLAFNSIEGEIQGVKMFNPMY